MPEERIYSSGREAYFNLNSTWYDPAGSWLDTRRKPFRYVDNTACVTCCNPRSNVPRRGGHNYRCYCYRPCTCTPGGNPRVRCCVHNPSGGPRDYWGRPIGDACDGCTGGHYSHAGSDCESCCGSLGGCGTGGGTVACAQPCATSGGVCAEPGCRPSGRALLLLLQEPRNMGAQEDKHRQQEDEHPSCSNSCTAYGNNPRSEAYDDQQTYTTDPCSYQGTSDQEPPELPRHHQQKRKNCQGSP
ncbi:uncharacterized protein LOC113425876 [Notechis scutatus]|uniref:Uncharacterized protein LOC113425876 n=1 Tax=Notechis scutatus TaxID=8663 RepID=A0A6J1VLM3_9SAUR|nr:uncharacterized protein LOC113425876 [Notechis scutatus]